MLRPTIQKFDAKFCGIPMTRMPTRKLTNWERKNFYALMSSRVLWLSWQPINPAFLINLRKSNFANKQLKMVNFWNLKKVKFATFTTVHIVERPGFFVTHTQCGSFRIFLSFRFYVKSIFGECENSKTAFFGHFGRSETLIWEISAFKTSIKEKFRASKCGKIADFALLKSLIWFHGKSES